MIVAIHQPQFLPWIPYFDKVDQADVFVYLDTVQYSRGLQNRNQILTAQGISWLTVPAAYDQTTLIKDVLISERLKIKKIVRTIQYEYANAKFCNLFDGLRDILEVEHETLAKLNIAVTTWMMEKLEIRTRCVLASELAVTGSKEELIINICHSLGASTYLSGVGARSYQRAENFSKHQIKLRYQNYENKSYLQCHGSTFVPNLSALDLILNVGILARQIMLEGRLPSIDGDGATCDEQ